jgi:hypothetical protein
LNGEKNHKKNQLGLRRLPSDDGEHNNQTKIDGCGGGDVGEYFQPGLIAWEV